MRSPSASPVQLLGALLLAALGACVAPAPRDPHWVALEAPQPSPPGDMPLVERIAWWEDRLPTLPPPDQAEANLRIGQLQIDAGHAVAARLAFRAAQSGHLAAEEQSQVDYGMGLSYLLEHRPDDALPFLRHARLGLAGPEREECAYLIAALEGHPPADQALAERVAAFLPSGLRDAPLPAVSSSFTGGLPVDVPRAAWRPRPMRANHSPMGRAWRMTIHHSAEPFTSTRLSDSLAEVRRIQSVHQDDRGWADIGYHFLIDPAGRIIEGRSLAYQGAHAGRGTTPASNPNRGNIGICLLGNFVPQPERGHAFARAATPTSAQLQSLRRLVDALRARFGIPLPEVHYHAEFHATACPGPVLEAWVRRLRGGGR